MALMPKRVKFRNVHRGKMRGVSLAGSRLNFGDYGLKAMDRHWLTGVQIEAARVALTRQVKRGGKIWIRVFPDKPITKKPLEVRMGKGKGPVEGYVFVVKPGRILFEIAGVPEELAKSALRLCAYKLPFRTKFIRRGEIE